MGHHPVEDSNNSGNRPLEEVINARLSRRRLLTGTASAATVSVLGSLGLAACGDSDSSNPTDDNRGLTVNPENLGFDAVATSLEDRVIVPEGYRADVLFAKGDPLAAGLAPFMNDGTDVDYDNRSGDEHDGMHFFGLNENGQYDPDRSDRGILCINHENLEDNTLHENGVTSAADNDGSRPKIEVDREMNGHGVSCVEVRKTNGKWQTVVDSPYNRRITIFTEMDIKGPVAGADFLKTKNSPDGRTRYGTMNNCANGFTPWGTYLAAEENWYAYFKSIDDTSTFSAKEQTLLNRYGIGAAWAYREWDTVTGDIYERFDASIKGASALEDFRNEPNLHGYVTEIDPFHPARKPRVRTSVGRFSHEGAWMAPVKEGAPVVIYSGDDSRREYMYKYVSTKPWDPADANGGLSAGDKYLDEGKLYVAVFNEDGTGEWKELTYQVNGLDNSNAAFAFESQAEVLGAARLAADSVGATPMDRPEWAVVHPLNGDVYLTLTNGNASNRPSTDVDGANPRAVNSNGHIIRWKEAGSEHAATTFEWDIFLFGASSDADANYNVSGLTTDNEFSSPDGLYIDPRGIIWIQTDDGALRDTTNNQMLVAIPGRVGDGNSVTVTTSDSNGQASVDTFVGQDAVAVQLKRFLVGPKGCEITGISMTADGRSLFINIQHPGEGGSAAEFNTDKSTWPATSGDATAFGEVGNRPRSATIVIYREDGGEIAL